MNNILLTGATGFVGSALYRELCFLNCSVRVVVRSSNRDFFQGDCYEIDSVDSNTEYGEALCGVDTVVHLAARAHLLKDNVHDILARFRSINTAGTINLARQAAEAGVKRFIFISSIGVNGINSSKPFTEQSSVEPHDAYSQSKYEAELGLGDIAANSEMEIVIIRPPLVYGGSAPGNFGSLLRLVSKSIPLPFGLVNNQRSMVYRENLVDFIIKCIDHPNAANHTFLISDGHDLSLSNLIRTIRKVMNKPAWLLPVPVWLFKLAGKLTGKTAVVDRLVGDLQVDSSKAQQLLDWKPPYTVEEGIKATVADFYNRK